MQISPNRLVRGWIGLICIVEMEWGPKRRLPVQFDWEGGVQAADETG